jgi:asparagine synthase (glutamine-hydrolysing)
MCGIAGIVGRTGEIRGQRPDGGDRTSQHQIVDRMVNALRHRGPDDEGISDCNEYAFGHTRLAIIDLSAAGHQPISTSDGHYQIVYNGEIYNYRELRKQLEPSGVRFRSDTDTEVILHLFAKYQEKCLDFLEGMFAFAIVDNQTGDLFIARDRLGIKPLYYFGGKRKTGSGKSATYSLSANTGQFLFASEIRALLASGLVPRRLDPISVNSYLSFGAVQEPHTILQDVRTLPPAHFMRVGGDGAIKDITRYWNLPPTNHVVTRAEALAQTRERFAHSVKSHLVSDVPLGAFLSSGIDSSAIVAMMSKFASNRVRTFSVCFNESEFSERYIAGRVAEKWNTAHTEVLLSEDDLLQSLPAAISDIDQPTIDGINTWAISKSVSEAGITVALSGVGGDELFGGYSSFRRVPALVRHAKTLNRIRGSKQLAAAAVRLFDDSIAAEKISTALAGPADPLSVYKSVRGLFGKDLRRALTNGNGLIRADYDLPGDTQALLNQLNGTGDLFNRISRFELNLYMANMLLRDTDTMSMAHGLEVRVPLLDHRFVEWVYSLPGEMKLGSHPKSFFVEAMGDDLLPEVAHQRKMGFTLPFERWLHTSLKQLVDETLSDHESVEQAGLDYGIVQEVWRRFQHGRRSISWSRIWALVVLVRWCRENGVARERSNE